MLSFRQYSEAVYPGNIGMMELAKFYKKADPKTKERVNKLIASDRKKEAWDIIQKTVGVKLDPSAFG